MKLKLDENLGLRGQDLLSTFAAALKTQAFHGSLWIVEDGRIRVFDPPG